MSLDLYSFVITLRAAGLFPEGMALSMGLPNALQEKDAGLVLIYLFS